VLAVSLTPVNASEIENIFFTRGVSFATLKNLKKGRKKENLIVGCGFSATISSVAKKPDFTEKCRRNKFYYIVFYMKKNFQLEN